MSASGLSSGLNSFHDYQTTIATGYISKHFTILVQHTDSLNAIVCQVYSFNFLIIFIFWFNLFYYLSSIVSLKLFSNISITICLVLIPFSFDSIRSFTASQTNLNLNLKSNETLPNHDHHFSFRTLPHQQNQFKLVTYYKQLKFNGIVLMPDQEMDVFTRTIPRWEINSLIEPSTEAKI